MGKRFNTNFSQYDTVAPRVGKPRKYGKVWAIRRQTILVKFDGTKVPVWIPKDTMEYVCHF